MKAEAKFKTEADLCAAFTAWAAGQGVQCFAEWAGWDILLVYPDGAQLGIQAKLRLNAEVIGQAAPDEYGWELDHRGPDHRAILVPETNGWSAIAGRLGLVVFAPKRWGRGGFAPDLAERRDDHGQPWLDWNPWDPMLGGKR